MPPPSSRPAAPARLTGSSSSGTPASMAQAAAAKAAMGARRALPADASARSARSRGDLTDVDAAAAPPAPLLSRWLLALLLVLGLLGAARVGLLLASGTGLQLDEAQYWHWSRDLHWGYYSKPPVVAALIAASTTLFGTSVLGVKALAMVCWLLVALLVYGFARDLMRSALRALADEARPPADADPRARHAAPAAPALPPADLPDRAGFWAALLFTTTPMAGLLGMAVTTDAPLLLCWTLASWLLWRTLHSGRLVGWIVLGLVLGVGLLSKYTLAAWLPSAAVLAWLARLSYKRAQAARHLAQDAARLRSGGATRSGFAPSTLIGSDTEGARTTPRQRVRRPRRLRCLTGLALALGVALLVCLPHLAWNATWGWPTLHHTADITTAAQRGDDVGAGASLGEFLGGQLLLIGPALALWLIVLAGVWLGRLVALLRTQGRAAAGQALQQQALGVPRPEPLAAPAPVLRGAAGRAAAGGSVSRAEAQPVAASLSLHLALAPARRHLLWLALPLLAVAAAQAVNARAQMNWTAPVVPLLCIWLALRLVTADGAPQVRRRTLALGAISLSLGLTLFAAAAPSVAAALGKPWPARLDLYIRMRGWPEAYAQLRPQVQAHPGRRVMGVNRTVISHGAWLWRDLDIDWAAWREPGPPHDHYQLTIPYDRIRPGSRAAALPRPLPIEGGGLPLVPAAPLPGAPPGAAPGTTTTAVTPGMTPGMTLPAAAPGAPFDALGEPLLVLAEGALPDHIRGRLNSVRLLHKAEVQTAPGRVLTLTLWSARLPLAGTSP